MLTPVVASRWGNLRTTVRFQWMCAPAIGLLALSTQLAVAVPVYLVVPTLRGMSDTVYTAFVQERVPEGIGPSPGFGRTPLSGVCVFRHSSRKRTVAPRICCLVARRRYRCYRGVAVPFCHEYVQRASVGVRCVADRFVGAVLRIVCRIVCRCAVLRILVDPLPACPAFGRRCLPACCSLGCPVLRTPAQRSENHPTGTVRLLGSFAGEGSVSPCTPSPRARLRAATSSLLNRFTGCFDMPL